MPVDLRREGFSPISSERKEIGWKEFLRFLPVFLEHPRPTRRELPLIHRLTTRGAPLEPIPKELEFEAMARLLTDDHPDIHTAEQIGGIASLLVRNFENFLRRDPHFLRREQTLQISGNGGGYRCPRSL